MNITLLSGAVKNAGDYLITERCEELLHYVFPGSIIDRYIRNDPLTEEQLDIINKSDCIIIGGGPCYKWDLYPDTIPLVKDLNRIKPKIFMLGCGWYGNTISSDEIWNYKFSESSMKLFNRIASDSHYFGCRDYYAVRVLQANGIKSGLMTGCPAWYDLGKIGKRISKLEEIHTIGVSDPADITHYGLQSLDVCKCIKGLFPNAKYHYFFHRGMKVDKYTDQSTVVQIQILSKELRNLGFEIHDISYSASGFSMYDSCDLHIGHRVHAHIYNLSQRKASVLIEEDSRGAGVNEPLGLWSIKAYKRKKEKTSSFFVKAYNKVLDYTLANPYVVNDLKAYLEYLENTNFQLFNQAFSQMEYYFDEMILFTKNINKIVEAL